MVESIFSRFRLRKRLPIMLLVLGPALLYFAWYGPRASSDHAVVFRFHEPLHDVRRVTATWSDARDEAGPLAGSTFDIRGPSETRELRTTVHVPDGDFWVDLEFEAPDGTRLLRRKVTLGEGETKLFLAIPAASAP